jgi:hypothetical protein
MLVFEAHPSSTQIRCTICDQETGIHKWISRPSARHHLDSQQHQNALNSVQQRLAAQQHCYGRLAVVSNLDDGGFALNVDKELR